MVPVMKLMKKKRGLAAGGDHYCWRSVDWWGTRKK